jgi:hypothetical protein
MRDTTTARFRDKMMLILPALFVLVLVIPPLGMFFLGLFFPFVLIGMALLFLFEAVRAIFVR